MYVVGFIKEANNRILINPKRFDNLKALFNWLTDFFNDKDFLLDIPLFSWVRFL